MKKLISFLLILSGCALRGQQSIPGINITPNSGSAGKIQLRTSANVNSMFLQDNVIDGSGLSTRSIIFTGSPTASVSPFIFNTSTGNVVTFCDTSSGGSWDVTRTRISGFNGSMVCGGGTNNQIYLQTDGTIATSLGICFFASTGLSGNTICQRAPSGAVTGSYTVNWPGTGPACTGDRLQFVTGSTYQWFGGCNWITYTPTITPFSGLATTSTLIGAYQRVGKTVNLRIYWSGTLSVGTPSVIFNSPGNALGGSQFQPFGTLYTAAGAATYVACAVQASSTNITCASSANFPSGSTLIIGLAGTYEEN